MCMSHACRVFHRTAPPEDKDFYTLMEREAAAAALLTVTLCRSDAEYMREHVMRAAFPVEVGSTACAWESMNGCLYAYLGKGVDEMCSALHYFCQCSPLLISCVPGAATSAAGRHGTAAAALRALSTVERRWVRLLETPCLQPWLFVQQLLSSEQALVTHMSRPHLRVKFTGERCTNICLPAGCAHMERRMYLTCCVRLSPEKEPDRFAALVEELARRGSLTRLSVVPMLCGSASGVPPSRLPARTWFPTSFFFKSLWQ